MMHPGLGYFDVRFLFLWFRGGNIFLRKRKLLFVSGLSLAEKTNLKIFGEQYYLRNNSIYINICCIYIVCVYIIDIDIFPYISICYACWHLYIYNHHLHLHGSSISVDSQGPHRHISSPSHAVSSTTIICIVTTDTIPLPQSYQLHLHHKLHHAHKCQYLCSVPLYAYLHCLTTRLAQHPFYSVVYATLLLLSH